MSHNTAAQRRNIRLTVLGLLLLALLVVGSFVRQFVSPEHLDPQWLQLHQTVLFDPPRSFVLPALIDQDAKPFDGARFNGTWSVLFFGFTFCPDVCPTTLAQLRDVQAALEPVSTRRRALDFYLVSVDPERDTPARLKPYINYFDPRFSALTGEPDQVQRFASQLNIPYRKVTDAATNSYTVDHSANLVLINPRGHYAGYITPPFDTERLRRVLEVLRTREY